MILEGVEPLEIYRAHLELSQAFYLHLFNKNASLAFSPPAHNTA